MHTTGGVPVEYRPVDFFEEIHIRKMVTVHYFQFARGYVFSGERHDFWEFVYMDKGSAEIGADERSFILNEGEAAFHQPGEFHTIWAGGNKPPDIVVLSFVCKSPAIGRFAGVRMAVGEEGKRLIAQIISESRNAWTNKLGSDYLELARRENPPAGAAQMVRLSLESLLIRLLRTRDCAPAGHASPLGESPAAGRKENIAHIAVEIERYMDEHMDDDITIAGLSRRFGLSATSLKQVFRKRKGGGVIEYLSGVRHEGAKRLIREGRLNMTAIAEKCGYGSVHYFSRKFTAMEGMTPTEYARSVKSMLQSDTEL
jgi:AraC-like DNA-binding protein